MIETTRTFSGMFLLVYVLVGAWDVLVAGAWDKMFLLLVPGMFFLVSGMF